jgi:cytochrome c oxidase cbb3-type subunit IV
MSAAWGHSVGAMILILMLSFIGIWLWAWLPYHKGNFDKLARLPMRDDAVNDDCVRATVGEGELR